MGPKAVSIRAVFFLWRVVLMLNLPNKVFYLLNREQNGNNVYSVEREIADFV